MGKIKLNNIRVHAWHGCLKEESIIGSDYRVDLGGSCRFIRPFQNRQALGYRGLCSFKYHYQGRNGNQIQTVGACVQTNP